MALMVTIVHTISSLTQIRLISEIDRLKLSGRGWHRRLPVDRANEAEIALEAERIRPFLLDRIRLRGGGRPEQLENISLIDQARQIRGAVLADFRISQHEEFIRRATALSENGRT